MDSVTLEKIESEIVAAETAKKDAAKRVRRLKRLKESATELEAIVSGEEFTPESDEDQE